MALPNIGLIGAAGAGKTTIANRLVDVWGYHRNALANPMKAWQGFGTHLQLNMPIPDPLWGGTLDPARCFDIIDRVIHGRTGVIEPFFSPGTEEVEDASELNRGIYEHDRQIRDYLIDFVNQNKAIYRTTLQQWGTEIIRHFAKGTDTAPDEPWVDVLLKEAQVSAWAGAPTVTDDVRHHHEAQQLSDEANFLFVRIEREGRKGEGIDALTGQHSSEQSWHEIPAHYRIVNNGANAEALDPILRSLLTHQSCLDGPHEYHAVPERLKTSGRYYALDVLDEIPVWTGK